MIRLYLFSMECHVYWLLKSSSFELFANGKYAFLSQKVDGRVIYTDYWKGIVLKLLVMGNTVFFDQNNWWKGDIYLVFLSFRWCVRTWEIWFFVQWRLNFSQLCEHKFSNIFTVHYILHALAAFNLKQLHAIFWFATISLQLWWIT